MTATLTEIEVTRQHDAMVKKSPIFVQTKMDRIAAEMCVCERIHCISSLVFPLLLPSLVSRHCVILGRFFLCPFHFRFIYCVCTIVHIYIFMCWIYMYILHCLLIELQQKIRPSFAYNISCSNANERCFG